MFSISSLEYMLFGFPDQSKKMCCIVFCLLLLREALIPCKGKRSNNTEKERGRKRDRQRWGDNVVKRTLFFIKLVRTLYIETKNIFKSVSYKVSCN